jgi:hypothetical protein
MGIMGIVENVGMVSAGSRCCANLWGSCGSWGMLAWYVLVAIPMPRPRGIGKLPNIGMTPAMGWLCILAWYVLGAGIVPKKKFY